MSIAITPETKSLTDHLNFTDIPLTYGLELEGFVVKKETRDAVQIILLDQNNEVAKGENTSLDQNFKLDEDFNPIATNENYIPITINDYIKGLIQDSDFKDLVSIEQIAGHIEFKTNTHQSIEKTANELFEVIKFVKSKIDDLGLDIIFQPIPPENLQAIPASYENSDINPKDRNKRTPQELLQYWKKQGIDPLLGALSSFQINFGFAAEDLEGNNPETIMTRLELAQILMNSVNQDLVDEISGNIPDNVSYLFEEQGTNRFQQLERLITESNKARFQEFRLESKDVLFPPYFNSLRDMLKWMVAFDHESKISALEFEDIYPENLNPEEERKVILYLYKKLRFKNFHPYAGIKAKIFENILVGELRYIDSREFTSAEEIAIFVYEQLRIIFNKAQELELKKAA